MQKCPRSIVCFATYLLTGLPFIYKFALFRYIRLQFYNFQTSLNHRANTCSCFRRKSYEKFVIKNTAGLRKPLIITLVLNKKSQKNLSHQWPCQPPGRELYWAAWPRRREQEAQTCFSQLSAENFKKDFLARFYCRHIQFILTEWSFSLHYKRWYGQKELQKNYIQGFLPLCRIYFVV
jgi:hypothetical protein